VCLLRSTDWIFIYRQFSIQQFYVLPTQCIYVFCVDLRTNSDYFPIYVSRSNWLVFIMEKECVYCAVETESVNAMKVNLCIKVLRNLTNTHYSIAALCKPWTGRVSLLSTILIIRNQAVRRQQRKDICGGGPKSRPLTHPTHCNYSGQA